MSETATHYARIARPLALAMSFALLLTVSAGCLFRPAETPLELDYSQTLPDNWQPVGTWRTLSIDDDDETEYLLLFTFDQGQVGGAIYDSQISPDLVGVVDVSATPVATPTVTLVPVPLQPLAYYRPYRLLPTSWSYAYGGNVGHGFFAQPGDDDSIEVREVVRPEPTGRAAEREAEEERLAFQPKAEAVILGGETHLTFVWWLNALHGYAISQLTAAGGFPDIDWAAWKDAPSPIDQISGLQPISDYRARSLLCRETQYTRIFTATHEYVQPDDAPTVAFAEEDRGIRFCDGSQPSAPYYPEGVVMKYLQLVDAGVDAGDASDGDAGGSTDADSEAADEGMSVLLSPGVDPASVGLEAGLIQLSEEMVADIVAYPTVPALPPRIVTGDFLPTTTVCVEAAQRQEPERRRWVLFTLRYQPADLENRMADRWTISGAEEMPDLADQQPPYQCESLLNATLE